MSRFVVGIPFLAEQELLMECLRSVWGGTAHPSRVILIDNGGFLPESLRSSLTSLIRPEQNLGVAASWNLIHKLAAPLPVVLVNDDTALAPDTLERMMVTPGPAVVCAWGYNCVRIDHEVWQEVGDFDERFFPAYYEDADHRHRCKVAGVKYVDWDPEPSVEVSPGRRRSAQGILHGKPAPPHYETPWFRERIESNKQYYEQKWGGPVGEELYRRPFG
jgi:glycosyl transferase family 2